jgi:DNA polymerase IV (DinB-like DNA polymerase)
MAAMRMIAHMDMDAFFAAIEERDNPRWTGMPIVVGADPLNGAGRGVVSTASYPAREYGIRSALPISTAWRYSQEAVRAGKPAAIFLPVNGRRYGQVSERVMEILSRYTPVVEQASVDEAYLDLSGRRSWSAARAACQRIKKDIFKTEKLTCSFGLGPNKLVAKIASDFHKPNGLTVVTPRAVSAFLAPLDIRKIPGIGPKSEMVFRRKELNTVADIQALTEADLYQLLGEWGLDVYEKVHGRGSDELVTEWTAQSIGEQETFDEDTLDSGLISERLGDMGASILRQLKRDGFSSFRRVVLTIRFEDFKTVTRSHMLAGPTDSPVRLRTETMRMLLPFFDRRENPAKKRIRLAGVRIEHLE